MPIMFNQRYEMQMRDANRVYQDYMLANVNLTRATLTDAIAFFERVNGISPEPTPREPFLFTDEED